MRGGLYVDRTGVFGERLVVVTDNGKIWSVGFTPSACVNKTYFGNAGTHLEGKKIP